MREEKASWRRGSPATAVTTAQLCEILAAAGLHDSVRSITLLSGGLVNSNYRLDLAGGEALVLRLYDQSNTPWAGADNPLGPGSFLSPKVDSYASLAGESKKTLACE